MPRPFTLAFTQLRYREAWRLSHLKAQLSSSCSLSRMWSPAEDLPERELEGLPWRESGELPGWGLAWLPG
jgi:hypothetical protein